MNRASFYFISRITMSGRRCTIALWVRTVKSKRTFTSSFSITGCSLPKCSYHLLVQCRPHLWHGLQCTTSGNLSCLLLYWVFASLLHSIDLFIRISGTESDACCLWICAFTASVVMAWWCAAIIVASISPFMTPLCSGIQVFLFLYRMIIIIIIAITLIECLREGTIF